VHDPFYEPLLVFGGWRQIENYDSGSITVWSKDDAPPARLIPSDAMPAPWEGWMWGILPMGSSILAMLFVWLLAEPRQFATDITVHREMPERVFVSTDVNTDAVTANAGTSEVRS